MLVEHVRTSEVGMVNRFTMLFGSLQPISVVVDAHFPVPSFALVRSLRRWSVAAVLSETGRVPFWRLSGTSIVARTLSAPG